MLNATQFARKVGLDPTRICVLCRQGRISGAVQVGRMWIIPDNAKILPPTGKRKLKLTQG